MSRKEDMLQSSISQQYKGGDILISVGPKHCYSCKDPHYTAIHIYKYKGFGTQGHKYSIKIKYIDCPAYGWKFGPHSMNEAELANYYRYATIAERILFL
jgi:hypothetical protein